MWTWSTFELLVLLVYLVLFASSYTSQAITIIKNKSSENVDLFAFIRLCIGQTFLPSIPFR